MGHHPKENPVYEILLWGFIALLAGLFIYAQMSGLLAPFSSGPDIR